MSSGGLRPGRRGELALAIAAEVDALDGVRRSGGGGAATVAGVAGTEIATQYPGGRVLGVQLSFEEVVVHIVAERLPAHRAADEVVSAGRRALDAAGDSRPVAVVVDDIDVDVLPGRTR